MQFLKVDVSFKVRTKMINNLPVDNYVSQALLIEF